MRNGLVSFYAGNPTAEMCTDEVIHFTFFVERRRRLYWRLWDHQSSRRRHRAAALRLLHGVHRRDSNAWGRRSWHMQVCIGVVVGEGFKTFTPEEQPSALMFAPLWFVQAASTGRLLLRHLCDWVGGRRNQGDDSQTPHQTVSR